jgi:hypothetical protein
MVLRREGFQKYHSLVFLEGESLAKTGAHKKVFATTLMIFSQKCYSVSIDNVTALIYNYY